MDKSSPTTIPNGEYWSLLGGTYDHLDRAPKSAWMIYKEIKAILNHDQDSDEIHDDQIAYSTSSLYPVAWMRPLDNMITTAEEILGTKLVEPLRSPLLPAYITEMSESTSQEDIDYLARKGVFEIPDMVLRNELLVTFVRNVHPYMPLLDISPFIDAIENNGQSNKISLLLLHAVMFSSAAFIEAGNRDPEWHVSRKQSRLEFYEKAKVCRYAPLNPISSDYIIADSIQF